MIINPVAHMGEHGVRYSSDKMRTQASKTVVWMLISRVMYFIRPLQ